MSNQEQERLKRLRERQLADRDPLVKQRQFQHNTSVKEKRMRKSFSFVEAWGDLPHIFKVPFYGLIVGVLIVIVLPNIWKSPYAFLAGAAVTLLLIIFGLIVGNALDIRDRIKNNMK